MTVTPEPTAVAAPITFNRLGLIGLLLVIVSFLVAIGFFIAGVIFIATDPNPSPDSNVGWQAVGAVAWLAFGVGIAAPVAIAGVVVGIVSLFRKNRGKALGIIAIILGLPYGLVGLVLLPLALTLLAES